MTSTSDACNDIEQEGKVIQITETSYKIYLYNEACNTCKLKAMCPSSKVKFVEVDKGELELKKGERVKVSLEEKQGVNALVLSYVVPFFILLTVLIVVKVLTNNDGIAGLAALASLVPYYLVLHLLREKIDQKFKLTVKKTQ